MFVNNSQNATIVEDLLDMWGAEIYFVRHHLEHHSRETQVVIVQHPLGGKDTVNLWMQLVTHVTKKEVTLVFNTELDGLLEFSRLPVQYPFPLLIIIDKKLIHLL